MYPKQEERRAVQRVCGSFPAVRLTREVMITTYSITTCVAKTASDRGNLCPKARQSEVLEVESIAADVKQGVLL